MTVTATRLPPSLQAFLDTLGIACTLTSEHVWKPTQADDEPPF